MKNFIATIFVLVLSTSTFAQQEGVDKDLYCAYTYAQEVKDELGVGFQFQKDKYLHCTVSCAVGLECGVSSSAILGVAKEIADVFGAGHAELEDLYANLRGLKLSLEEDIVDLDSCSQACLKIYQ